MRPFTSKAAKRPASISGIVRSPLRTVFLRRMRRSGQSSIISARLWPPYRRAGPPSRASRPLLTRASDVSAKNFSERSIRRLTICKRCVASPSTRAHITRTNLAPTGSDCSRYPGFLRLSKGARDSADGIGYTSPHLIPGMRPCLVRIESNPQGTRGNLRRGARRMAAVRAAYAEVVGFAQYAHSFNSASAASIIKNVLS